ncbi:DUF4157 domain-containing protein [Solwaraspora sp. WMMB762]|uniref:eCIS core domain-containing protein n=1 Tax=Solwaraspora sp. WMMB762 TaxID=3404120 RepID=UPI003B954AC5
MSSIHGTRPTAARTPVGAASSTPSVLARGPAGSRGALLALHRRYGNRRVQSVIQAKLSEGSLERPAAGGSGTSGGRALPEGIRSSMEEALGRDLSSVRVHEDKRALSMNALAFTRGNHIHFAPGHYRPWTRQGEEALRHEIVHVEQQAERRVPVTGRLRGVGLNDDPQLERDADERGRRAARAEGFHTRESPLAPKPPLDTGPLHATRLGDAAPKELAPLPLSTDSAAPIQRITMKDFNEVADDVEYILHQWDGRYIIGGSYAFARQGGHANYRRDGGIGDDPNLIRFPEDFDLWFFASDELDEARKIMLDTKIGGESLFVLKYPDRPRVDDQTDSAEFGDDLSEGSLGSGGGSDGTFASGTRSPVIHRRTEIEIDMSTLAGTKFATFPDVTGIAPVSLLLAGALDRDDFLKQDHDLIRDLIRVRFLRKEFIGKILTYVVQDRRADVTELWNSFF